MGSRPCEGFGAEGVVTTLTAPSDTRRKETAATGRSRSLALTGGAWVVAAVIALVVWEVLSRFTQPWVPPVADVAASIGAVLTSSDLLTEAGVTLRRVALVTVASIGSGVALGVLAGFSWQVRAFLRPVLVIALAIPDLVYLIMAILVLGATESSGVIAMTVAIIPLVTNAVLGAVLARDSGLDEMARTYRFSRGDYARHVVLEQLKPALAAAVKTGFAFSWKLIVLMEALTMPDGVGARIYEGFRYLRPEDMLAWALVFIVVMKVVEQLLVRPLRAKKY